MSTRANVIIKDKHQQLIFYRHGDGYPEGALPSLKKFMSWVVSGQIRNNVSQASGWLIMIGAQEYGTIYDIGGVSKNKTTLTEPMKENIMSGWKVGAYEPTPDIHGDIEYLYVLDLIAKTIEVQEIDGAGNHITVDKITKFTDTDVSSNEPQKSRFEGIVPNKK